MNELPTGWAIAQLAEICHIEMGQSPPSSTYNTNGTGLPFLQGKGEFGELYPTPVKYCSRPSKVARAGAVLLSVRAPVGPTNITPSECCIGRGLAAISPLGEISIRFILWALRNHESALAISGTGSTFAAVSKAQVVSIPIALPPIGEQRRIVERIEALLDEIDRGVESLRAAKHSIALYRQSLLKSAFEGRLTADWRAQNPDKLENPDELLARIREEREARYQAALYEWDRAISEWRNCGEIGRKPTKPKKPTRSEKCKHENLRELPDGWFYLSFDGLAWSIRNGISAKPDDIGPLRIFRISAVRPMAFDLNEFRYITDTDGSMEDYNLKYGDLVFTRYNGSRDFVGVSAVYRGDGNDVYPDKLIRCQIDSDIIDVNYLEGATNCGESRSHLEGRIRTTAGQSGVSGRDIRTIPIPICSPAEQSEVVRVLEARLEASEMLDMEIDANLARADALRQSVLKRAFAGQLVPQDPDDEPAAALLERIKTNCVKLPGKTRRRASYAS